MLIYPKIMVALDGSEMDATLLRFTGHFSEKLNCEQIIGFHVIPVFAIADLVKIDPKFPFVPVAPPVEKIREVLHQKAVEVLPDRYPDIRIVVEEGSPYSQLILRIGKIAPSLLVFGKKDSSSGSGITTRRVARNIGSDILLVPEHPPSRIERLIVPLDFSENSLRALQIALQLQDAMGLTEKLTCVHLIQYDPPIGYTDPDHLETLQRSLPQAAKKHFEAFASRYRIDTSLLDLRFVDRQEKNIAQSLYDFLQQHPHDLVVMGARGHTLLENFLFGSVTERSMELLDHTPLLVVR